MSTLRGRTIIAPRDLIPLIIEDLYEGVFDAAVWGRAMTRLSDLVGASGANLVALDPSVGQVLRDESHRLNPALGTAYREHWSAQDILVAPALRCAVGEPTPDHKLVPAERWKRSAIFNELALPFDSPHALATLLHKSPNRIVALSFKTSARHGPFQDPEVDRLRPVIPHIRRALAIRDRLDSERLRADALSESLNHSNYAVVLLDGEGRVVESSEAAREIMCRTPGIRVQGDRRLSLPEPARSDLSRWILSGVGPLRNVDGLLKVPRANERLPVSILVTRLPHRTTSWMSRDAAWMLLLFDPEGRTEPSAALVARDLGISEREAEIASLLALGLDLGDVVVRLGISANTARTHLKAIFAKTGIHSQAELIRRITGGPACGHRTERQ